MYVEVDALVSSALVPSDPGMGSENTIIGRVKLKESMELSNIEFAAKCGRFIFQVACAFSFALVLAGCGSMQSSKLMRGSEHIEAWSDTIPIHVNPKLSDVDVDIRSKSVLLIQVTANEKQKAGMEIDELVESLEIALEANIRAAGHFPTTAKIAHLPRIEVERFDCRTTTKASSEIIPTGQYYRLGSGNLSSISRSETCTLVIAQKTGSKTISSRKYQWKAKSGPYSLLDAVISEFTKLEPLE